MRNVSFLKAGLAAVALIAMAPSANADNDGVNVGTLRCPVDGRDEHYTGELSRYGIELG